MHCVQRHSSQLHAQYRLEFSVPPSSRRHKKAWLHVDLAQPRHTAEQLHQSLHPLQHPHMAEANLLDELQPRMLTQARHRLRNPEHSAHDIMAAIPQIPKILHSFSRIINLPFPTRLDDRLDFDRMRRIDDLEHVLSRHEPEACGSRLQIIDRLAHIPLSAEDERREPIIIILHLLRFADLVQPYPHLLFRQPCIPQNRTSALQRLDDLIARIARECEARCRAVYLHRSSQRLLRTARHAIRFVQDHELMATLWESDFFLREALDAVAHDVDATFVAGVEFEHGFFAAVSQ